VKRRVLLQQDLARALGISPAMVSRLKRQGMPTHSVAAATEWRRRNLDPAQLHEAAIRRGRANPAGGAEPLGAPADDGREALAQVTLLAAAAAADFDRWGEKLRAAMAVLPRARWDEVALTVPVWERLLEPYLAQIRAECPPKASPPHPGFREVGLQGGAAEAEAPPGGDAGLVDDFVYMLAAGIVQILPESAVQTYPLPGDDAPRHG
jgi:hypothetical protein